jgi:hypothetical protein
MQGPAPNTKLVGFFCDIPNDSKLIFSKLTFCRQLKVAPECGLSAGAAPPLHFCCCLIADSRLSQDLASKILWCM